MKNYRHAFEQFWEVVHPNGILAWIFWGPFAVIICAVLSIGALFEGEGND